MRLFVVYQLSFEFELMPMVNALDKFLPQV